MRILQPSAYISRVDQILTFYKSNTNKNTFVWDSKNKNTNINTTILKFENTYTPIPDFKDKSQNTLENIHNISHKYCT